MGGMTRDGADRKRKADDDVTEESSGETCLPRRRGDDARRDVKSERAPRHSDSARGSGSGCGDSVGAGGAGASEQDSAKSPPPTTVGSPSPDRMDVDTTPSMPPCLPAEVWYEILNRLPAHLILRARLVSRVFCSAGTQALLRALRTSTVRFHVSFSDSFPFNPAIEPRRQYMLKEWNVIETSRTNPQLRDRLGQARAAHATTGGSLLSQGQAQVHGLGLSTPGVTPGGAQTVTGPQPVNAPHTPVNSTTALPSNHQHHQHALPLPLPHSVAPHAAIPPPSSQLSPMQAHLQHLYPLFTPPTPQWQSLAHNVISIGGAPVQGQGQGHTGWGAAAGFDFNAFNNVTHTYTTAQMNTPQWGATGLLQQQQGMPFPTPPPNTLSTPHNALPPTANPPFPFQTPPTNPATVTPAPAPQPGPTHAQPRLRPIHHIGTFPSTYPIPPAPIHASYSSMLFTRAITLRCVAVDGADGPVRGWRVKYAVAGEDGEVQGGRGEGKERQEGERKETEEEEEERRKAMEPVDDNERWIARGGVFDFVQRHMCGFANTPGLMHSPRPCLRASTWPASVPHHTFPRLLDPEACRNVLGEGGEGEDAGQRALGAADHNEPSNPTSTPPPRVTRTPGGFLVPFAAGDSTLSIHVFETLPAPTRIPPLPESSQLPPAPGRPQLDPVLSASFVDKLGYHVDLSYLQAQDHEWFGAVEGFECGVGWVLRGRRRAAHG
ncbi:hypothetical protein M427DRAFT_464421 [Gonapodya prolifera JEL478]|uniref:F-box domain-containing protein n=1 Tax=Gonapodya prolifera (strain JEL478) TaxID=1344416 RepID=A0A139A1T0_GONPJ|nr:hypothetical protein M427DRAFT_464421 [Gonapodya prolifera JEL478]|eukprot:KXS10722.1 hypothetical protein M427DRAFT_464421 [Gonapodya prolifera JEL478]